MHGQKARFFLYLTVVLSLLIMLPSLFMYGTRTVETPNGGIGCTCYIRDAYYLTEWHILFRSSQFALNFALFVMISLLYILVYRTVHQRIRAPSTPSLHSPQSTTQPKGLFRQRSSKKRKVSPAPDNVPTIRIDPGGPRKKPSVSSVSSVELNMQIREICKNKTKCSLGESSMAGNRRIRIGPSNSCFRLAFFLCGCIRCKEITRRESVTPMVHSIAMAESSSSQEDRKHSLTSAPASMIHEEEVEDIFPEQLPVKKISDGILIKKRESTSTKHFKKMDTLKLFAENKLGQRKGGARNENNIQVEENSLAAPPKIQTGSAPDVPEIPEHRNGIRTEENNCSKGASSKSKNKFNLTLPSADRPSIYQAGMMVGRMRRISLPVSYRQNSMEETTAYLSEAALNHYQRTRYKTAMILLTVTVIYLLTWTPFWILYIVFYVETDFWDKMDYVEQNAYRMLRYMYMINHAINPVIYAFAHKQFRDDLKTVFKKICCRNRY